MKWAILSLCANIPAIICLAIAGMLAIKGDGDWGWFLFIGLLIVKSVEFKDCK
jgi:hypothetical protein